ncbi:tudor domain-containing protein qin isoform X2 [Musca autumnalis]|uniref:tudor domain-containing protein qin isoform X2 n=1 Tax=Musca autumnalis TaxID=221902 RepID=UPI003CF7D6A8
MKISKQNQRLLQLKYNLHGTETENINVYTSISKDIKAAETKLEEFASKTVEDISDYFLNLHSYIQNKEKEILDKFAEICHQPQFLLSQAFGRLNESKDTLDIMRENLEIYQRKAPSLVHLGKLLQKYNDRLYQLPCDVTIEKISKNPFNFEVQMNDNPDLEEYIKYSFDGPNLTIDIRTFKDYSNFSLLHSLNFNSSSSISCDNSINDKNTQRRNQREIQKQKKNGSNKGLKKKPDHAIEAFDNASVRSSPMSVDNNASCSVTNENLVRVSHVNSPEHFYIQRVSDVEKIRELSQAYVDMGQAANIPKNITVGYYYMFYHSADKQWYRSKLKNILSKDEYNVFLVDLGMEFKTKPDKLCNLQEAHLKIPFAAVRCAIADIIPAEKQWTEEANTFLKELVQNKNARISIIEKISSDFLKIDLHTSVTNSVRESFLYAGLARERPGALNFKMHIKKKYYNVKPEEQIPRNYFTAGELLMVNMLHVVGPHEFYVVKEDLFEERKRFLAYLNVTYGPEETKHQQIYLATANMCCAVIIDNDWHRARILEVKGKGSLLVRLVDKGRCETINWRQAFVLTEEFRQKNEYAIRCTLADIEPLQKNSYMYTPSAIADFRQMTVNPCLRMEIHSTTEELNRVLLYVSKKNLDINIGAALVKSRHGISTGETTQVSDCFRMTKRSHRLTEAVPSDNLNVNQYARSQCSSIASIKSSRDQEQFAVQRSAVIITHIIDPGEFYIQLSTLKKGTDQFHAKIQETQNEKFGISTNFTQSKVENRQWVIGSHCLVYTNFNKTANDLTIGKNCEWYRGIITEANQAHVSETTFSVFLRDIGATIRSIAAHQLFSIDPRLDRVTNAVYRCHLAGISPAGNAKSWSKSAIDCFQYWITIFESQWVSMRGKRLEENNSLPVVLWGSSTDTADPLAPCIIKYTNISKILVDKGLAYSPGTTENITEHFEKIEGIDLKEGEITIQKWFKCLEDDITLNAIVRKEQCPGTLFCNQTVNPNDVNDNMEEEDDHPFNVYLNDTNMMLTTGMDSSSTLWSTSKDLNKTLFTGYATYVDYGCIIYLHEGQDKEFLTKLKTIISDMYANLPEPPSDYTYTRDQPCIARYHLDSKIYRATITNENINSSGELEVRFVDYGDVENVEPIDIRPYAPFPNMPSLANKYQLIGIQQNYECGDLDQMHRYIVGKLVSVRLAPSELSMPIKKCNMRLGTVDVASTFIEKGWAAAETIGPVVSLLNDAIDAKLSRNRNPLPTHETGPDTYYEDFDVNHLNQDSCAMDIEPSNWMALPQKKEEQIADIIDRVEKRQNNLLSNITQSRDENKSSLVTPPTKKRMFDHTDYTQMMNGGLLLDVDALSNISGNDMKNESCSISEGDDEDIVEMSHTFAMNYWHSVADDIKSEEEDAISQQLEQRISFQEEEDVESEYENFRPNDTSTIFTHFSGVDAFKTPKFPGEQQHFKCRVIKIISPTVVQIFPETVDYKNQDINMQINIRRAVKTARPLTNFEPCTPCLACYSRDKKWYRAVIRSYNPTSKMVEVTYVDYLNSETIPTKFVRECPPLVLSWPQRTFRVRLHGIKPNPNQAESVIRLALHRAVAKRTVIAVVNRLHNSHTSSDRIDNLCSDKDLNEITLYESELHLSSNISIHKNLIKSKLYLRI